MNSPSCQNNVFISYSSKDAEIALKVHTALQRQNISCWIAPVNIPPGEHFADQIVRAIREARVMVLVLSPAFVQSKHTRRELTLADSEGLEVIPLRICETRLDDAWLYFLCDRQWKDAMVAPLEDRVFELAKAIQLMVSRGKGVRKGSVMNGA